MTRSPMGQRSPASLPTSLSTALCRPMSSAMSRSSPSGVKAAAAWSPPVRRKASCASTHPPRQPEQHRRLDQGSRRQRPGGDPHRIDRRLAAYTARRRGVEVPSELLGIDHHTLGEHQLPSVGVGQRLHLGQLRRVEQDPLGEGEPGHQMAVVARGAHHDRDRNITQPDLERGLGDDGVVHRLEATPRGSKH